MSGVNRDSRIIAAYVDNFCAYRSG